MKKITIIPENGLVMIDGKGFDGLDMSSLAPDIHAVQWHGEYGEVEYRANSQGMKPANARIDSLDAYASVLATWYAARASANTILPAPTPTPEDIRQQLERAVDLHMDGVARSKGYGYPDMPFSATLSLSTYGDTGHPEFDAEGVAFKAWRSRVWERCFLLLEEVQSGERPVPSEAGMIALLPQMEWPS